MQNSMCLPLNKRIVCPRVQLYQDLCICELEILVQRTNPFTQGTDRIVILAQHASDEVLVAIGET